MILAVAADISVQFEVAPLGRQLWSVRSNMAGCAGLAGLNSESRHSKRLPGSLDGTQQQQVRKPKTEKYKVRRLPALGAPSDRVFQRRRFAMHGRCRNSPRQSPFADQ